MNSLALQHQISNALVSHGKINGMTQTALGKLLGVNRQRIGSELKLIAGVTEYGRGVAGSPFTYKYVPVSVFCDEPTLNKPKTESMGWREFSIKMLLIGGGVLWWVERVIDALEWIF